MGNRPIWEKENAELRAELAEYQSGFMDVRAENSSLRSRIEELDRIVAHMSSMCPCFGGIGIHLRPEQISRAWENTKNGARDFVVGALEELDIHRCEGCGGSGRVESRSSSMREDPMVWKCPDCAEWGSHGFVVKS